MNYKSISKEKPVICWWSGGVTSAVACKLMIDSVGVENVLVVFLDTKNEHPSTYEFLKQCEKWYGAEIMRASSGKYRSIEEVWIANNSLNVANGAICSTRLKRDVRIALQKKIPFSYQVFGFDIDEIGRAKAMRLNNSDAMPVFPLINELYSKKDCISYIQQANDMFTKIDIPEPYKLGYNNNNCFQTGCVQGGVGYWQKMKREFPGKFNKMAYIEHLLTNRKGSPVTMLKVTSKGVSELVFLKPHSNYPHIKDISMLKGREPKPLMDCNGFCGTNDLITKNETEQEINYQQD